MLLKLNRDEMQSTIAFTTGHGKFKAHLEKMNLITDSNYSYCGRKDTAKHIMCECVGYAILRQKIVNKMHCKLKDYAKLDFKTIQGFCNKAHKKCINSQT